MSPDGGALATSEETWLQRGEKRIRSIPPKRRGLVILVVGVLLLGGLIALDQGLLRPTLEHQFGTITDLSYYRERTQLVLDGKWLYKDLPTESPPLIVYMMVPAQLAGGSELAYEIYFSIFTLLTGLLLYYGLRKFDDYRAFIVGLLFLLSPFATVESTFGIQDESIVIFIFMLAVVLAIRGSGRLSAAFAAVGLWTKMISVLYYPVLFIRSSWKERATQLAILAIISLAVCLPFLIFAFDEFIRFPLYYFLGIGGITDGSGDPANGVSVWSFLREGGIEIPAVALLAMTVGGLLFSYWYGWKKRYTIWPATLLVLTVFVFFYPRIWMGYFMLPVGLLLVWGSANLWTVVRCYLMYLPLLFSLLFTTDNYAKKAPIDIPYGWVIGLLLTIVGLVLLVQATMYALRTKPFIEERQEPAVR